MRMGVFLIRGFMVHLDERLSTAEQLIGKCKRLVDIGSNHGFLPVHLLQSGLCENALLCDISADALSRAQILVEKTDLQEKVEFAVTDGLNGIALQDGDAVSICGMGARTIAHILNRALPCPVVLQANVELKFLRRHIESIGMHIADEAIAFATGRYYVLLRAESGQAEPMSDYEAHIGPILLRKNPPLFKDYLLWRKGVTGRALEGTKDGSDFERMNIARQEYEDVLRALEETK